MPEASRSATPTAAPSSAPSERPSSTASGTTDAPVEVLHGDRGKAQVALTFHGAGDPKIAESLLTEAERAGAKVTVLAIGQWLLDNPSLADRILGGGHELGNHTYTHPALARLGAAAAYDEIRRCADVLQKQTGSPGSWFRPSGTPRSTARILAAAGRAGYRHVLAYDLDPLDYTDPGGDLVRKRVAAGVRKGGIVSLHLGHAGTLAALPGILDDLHRQGLTAVTATELLTT
jgi:peptidoglycan/xylan/chitin deacetylase (PgdA/CDA1 family)